MNARRWASRVLSGDTPFWQHTLDGLLELYVDWREESRTVWLAYERWCSAERATQRLAYAAYRAALEREERAASVYAAHVDSVQRHCT